jgi:hypothetical protein
MPIIRFRNSLLVYWPPLYYYIKCRIVLYVNEGVIQQKTTGFQQNISSKERKKTHFVKTEILHYTISLHGTMIRIISDDTVTGPSF